MSTMHWLQGAAILFGITVGVCIVLGVNALSRRKGWW